MRLFPPSTEKSYATVKALIQHMKKPRAAEATTPRPKEETKRIKMGIFIRWSWVVIRVVSTMKTRWKLDMDDYKGDSVRVVRARFALWERTTSGICESSTKGTIIPILHPKPLPPSILSRNTTPLSLIRQLSSQFFPTVFRVMSRLVNLLDASALIVHPRGGDYEQSLLDASTLASTVPCTHRQKVFIYLMQSKTCQEPEAIL